MPRYVPVTTELSVVEQEVKVKKVTAKKGPVNHIWIYDRSGSMTWALPELTKELIVLSKGLPKNDTLSLGWFSGLGDYNWVFKGFKISDDSDYKVLEKAIKANSSSRNTTCFSEILADTDTVIKDLSVFSKVFSMHFFTDGYPVVSNYSREIEAIYKAIKAIKGKVHASMFVGYGAYYNKELLQKMAERLGSLLIHSSLIPEYSSSITKLVELSSKSEPKEEIDPIVKDPLAIYTVTEQGVVLHSIDEDGKLYVSPQDGKSTLIYYISAEKPNKKSWDKVEIKDILFSDEEDVLGKSLYGAALVLTQQTKTDVAMEIIGKIGDKHIVDGLTNAFTIEEYGAVEDEINKSIDNVSIRFQTGRDPNYLPPVDAFCVFDLLKMLMADQEACFYPYHEKVSYERIGVASKTRDGYSSFHADKFSKCFFENLTWHDSRLNLSVKTTVNGLIDLQERDGKKACDLGLEDILPTYVHRNYTFIKDGRVHTKRFYLSSSQQTYKFLKNLGLVYDDTFSSDGIYGVDISKIPAVNRKIATGKTSATELCKNAMIEKKLEATIKALKWYKKELSEDQKAESSQYTDEQADFLKQNGVMIDRDGSYNPPRDKEEAQDQYMAKSFEIKMAGLNSLPTVKKVAEKIASKKSRTPVESLIEEGINLFEKGASKLDNTKKVQWLSDEITKLNASLKDVRSSIQETKFSVILGKKWFDEFKSRDENTLEVDGVKYSFELSEVAVEI